MILIILLQIILRYNGHILNFYSVKIHFTIVPFWLRFAALGIIQAKTQPAKFPHY